MDDELIYLDNAATSFPKPEEVYDFMFDFYKNHGVNPGRAGYDLSVETEEIVIATRKRLTHFFQGRDYKRLIFTYNASDALNLIINGMVTRGDHIITSTHEHNSVLRPLYHKQITEKIQVDHIPFDSRGFVNPDDFKSKIKKNTRLVILTHCSNVIGTLQPVAEIGEICQKQGVVFVVDASQTAGITPIDCDAMYIDIVVFTGHKSLMGPTGIGGLYVREGIEIAPTRFGKTGIHPESRLHPEEYPHRLECGTINIIGVAGLFAGQNWLYETGLDNILKHENSLWKKLRDGLKDIEGVRLYCAESGINHLPVLSVNISGLDAPRLERILDEEHHIATRAGYHSAPLVHQQLDTKLSKGTVRISPGFFNTEQQITATIDAIAEIAAQYGR